MSEMTALQLLGPSTGGIRVHVATLAAGLEDLGVRAPVVGPRGVLDGLGPQAGEVPVPAGLSPLGWWRARTALRPWRGEADVVHTHGLKAAWTALGGRPRRPIVCTVHNVVLDESAGRLTRIQRPLERQVLQRVDRVVALTTSMAEELGAFVPAERLRVALPASRPPEPSRPAGEVRRELGVAPDAPLVVCAARLHPQKDLPTLLRAWRLVSRERPDAQLRIVGDGPLRAELEAEVARLGIGGTAALVGHVPRAVDHLAAADVAVMTSIWEGASIVLAECTQLGVPVVSTPTGMAADLLDGERGGVLVPVGDHEAVAAALADLLGDPERARRLGERGREHARRVFEPRRAIGAVADIYREVVQ